MGAVPDRRIARPPMSDDSSAHRAPADCVAAPAASREPARPPGSGIGGDQLPGRVRTARGPAGSRRHDAAHRRRGARAQPVSSVRHHRSTAPAPTCRRRTDGPHAVAHPRSPRPAGRQRSGERHRRRADGPGWARGRGPGGPRPRADVPGPGLGTRRRTAPAASRRRRGYPARTRSPAFPGAGCASAGTDRGAGTSRGSMDSSSAANSR